MLCIINCLNSPIAYANLPATMHPSTIENCQIPAEMVGADPPNHLSDAGKDMVEVALNSHSIIYSFTMVASEGDARAVTVRDAILAPE